MNALEWLLVIIHTLSALGMIVFVLLHSGKGTGLSSMFGGMMPSTSAGTGIIERNLDRITIGTACVFAVTSLLLMVILGL
ncbi:MAG: preprotein translocase subunit SecG [Coriobacteriia bacterium]|nr:preprotein translocase subunit SecG [Coriobacteriia bacterium]